MLLPEHIKGNLFIKADNCLPISGSIEERGAIYEVLVIAEKIAIAEGLIEASCDFELFATAEGWGKSGSDSNSTKKQRHLYS